MRVFPGAAQRGSVRALPFVHDPADLEGEQLTSREQNQSKTKFFVEKPPSPKNLK